MSAAAMTLSGGGQYAIYDAIYGTNNPGLDRWIRVIWMYPMDNGDILDLYGCVSLGTKVVVLPSPARQEG
jgi:hypothetical protein